MKKAELIKAQQVDHISNEYRILSSISHPFIVPFHPLRSTILASLRTLDTSTCLWNMCQEGNFLPISEKKACSRLTKQR